MNKEEIKSYLKHRDPMLLVDSVELVTEQDKEEIISYCKHDVWSTMQFYKSITKIYVDSKLTLCKVFNLPLETAYKATNATLVGKILGAVRTSYPDSAQLKITLPKQIEEYIKYSLPKSIVDHVTTSPEKLTVNFSISKYPRFNVF